MGLSDRLADVDRELDAFRKGDQVLEGVRERARALVRTISELDAALDAIGEGITHPSMAERAIAERASAERASAERASAERASAERSIAERAMRTPGAGVRTPDQDTPRVEEVRELSHPEHAAEIELPPDSEPPTHVEPRARQEPILELEGAPLDGSDDTTDIRDPNSLEMPLASELDAGHGSGRAPAALPPRQRPTPRPVDPLTDTAVAGSLDHLFDDAPIESVRPSAPSGGLADLFGTGIPIDEDDYLHRDETSILSDDEVHALRRSSAPASSRDIAGHVGFEASLEAELEGLLAEPLAESSERVQSGDFEVVIDEDGEEPLLADDTQAIDHETVSAMEAEVSARESARPAASAPPSASAPPPATASSPPASTYPTSTTSRPPPKGGGFFSRILNRKP
jgi:hypothetical protein